MQETQVWSLDQGDLLEKEMATYCSILAWKIPWMEPGRLLSMGSQRVRHDWATSLSFHFPIYITAEHWIESSVWYSRFSLAVCFKHRSVYVYIHYISYPCCPLGVHKFVLYICVSISALQITSSVPFFLDSTYKRYHTIFVFLLLS